MKRDAKRLDLVKQVFAKRELVLAKKLSSFQGQLAQAVGQLTQLRAHRERHSAQLRDGQNTDPGRLQNQQAFQQRLNDAISQQEMLIKRAEVEQAELRQQWLAKRCKTMSVEKLCDVRIEEADSADAAREQKLQDEAASRTAPPKLD